MKLTQAQQRVLAVLHTGGTLHAYHPPAPRPSQVWVNSLTPVRCSRPTLEALLRVGAIQVGKAALFHTSFELTDPGREAARKEQAG